MKKVIFSLFLVSIFSFMFGYTEVSGNISEDTTWNDAVYSVTNNIHVQNNATLTIAAGTIIKFHYRKNIQVSGNLVLQSTSTSKIIFTSIKDDTYGGDTNNDGSSSTPNDADWGYFKFTTADEINFHDVIVKYGGYNSYCFYVQDSVVEFNSCHIEDCHQVGILANCNITVNNTTIKGCSIGIKTDQSNNEFKYPIISNCTFEENTYPVVQYNGSFPVYYNNTFTNNSYQGIGVQGTISNSELTAECTWSMEHGLPYILSDHLTINDNITLSIPAGFILKATINSSGYGYYRRCINVNGNLLVNGTENNPVYFTSLNDDSIGGDTNSDSDNSIPNKGDWGYIKFNSSAQSSLEHCYFRFGGRKRRYNNYSSSYDQNYLLWIDNANIELNNVVVQSAYDIGISTNSNTQLNNTTLKHCNKAITTNQLNNEFKYPIISNCSFEENTYPIIQYNGSFPIYSNNTFTNNSYQGIGVQGTISNSELTAECTWSLEHGLPYILTGNLTINDNINMMFSPGLVLKGQNQYNITVNGNLTANGLENNPIYVTSIKNDLVNGDTNSDLDNSTPAKGDWGYIKFSSTSQSSIANCFLSYGGYNSYNLYVDNADLSIDNISIENAQNIGLLTNCSITISNSNFKNCTIGIKTDQSNNEFKYPIISNCTFEENTYPVVQYNGSFPVYYNNTFTNNSYQGIGVQGTISNSELTAECTWSMEHGLPYILSDHLTINDNITLSIPAGFILKATINSSGYGYYRRCINVNGNLLVNGTENNPVYFTSLNDDSIGGDTNSDSDNSIPNKGDWGYIKFNSSAQSSLEHCYFRFGGRKRRYNNYSSSYDQNYLLWIDNANIELNNVVVQSAYDIGISTNSNTQLNNTTLKHCNKAITTNQLNNEFKYPIISNCSFEENTYPIIQYNGSFPIYSNNTFTNNSYQGIGVQGTISNSELTAECTWSLEHGLPYILTGNLTINDNINMMFSPGLVLKGQNQYNITVNGNLTANGLENNPIYVTSIKNDLVNGDTNSDLDNSTPAKGDWGYIKFSSTSQSSIANCFLSYGGYNSYNLYVDNADLSIDNISIENAQNIGLLTNCSITISNSNFKNCTIGIKTDQSNNEFKYPIISNCTFEENTYPVVQYNGSFPVYYNNTFTNNSYQGIGVQGTISNSELTAECTWSMEHGLPYILSDHLTINDNITLSIPAGFILKATINSSGYGYYRRCINVNGNLLVNGTENNPVYFTSLNDDSIGGDTNSDSDNSIPNKGDWGYIKFNSSAQSSLEHCYFRFGGRKRRYNNYSSSYDQNYLLWIDNANIELNNVVVQSAYDIGISTNSNTQLNNTTLKHCNKAITTNQLNNEFKYPIISNCSFEENTYPIIQYNGSFPIYSNNTFTNNSYQGIGVQGTISNSELTAECTWSLEHGLPYILTGNLTINDNINMMFSPGLVLKGQNQYNITVNGNLTANGLENNPIYVTSIKNDLVNGDTNSDLDNSTPAKGDWGYIKFSSTSQSSIANCFLSYGGYNSYNLYVDNADLSIDNISIENAQNIGLLTNCSITISNSNFKNCTIGIKTDQSNNEFKYPIISNCTFEENTYPVVQYNGSFPVYYNNTFTNNSYQGIGVQGTISNSELTAECTWSMEHGLPYILSDHLTINDNITLSIPAGFILKATINSSGYGYYRRCINVNGNLLVNGTENNPVYFTSLNDDSIGGDTNSDSDNSIPNKGDWGYIKFNSSAQSSLEHCYFRFGGRKRRYNNYSSSYDQNYLLWIDNANIELNNVVVQSAYDTGIYIYGDEICNITNSTFQECNTGVYINDCSALITDCLFTFCNTGIYFNKDTMSIVSNSNFSFCSDQAIYLNGNGENPTPLVTDCNFINNQNFNVKLNSYQDPTRTLNFEDNWWGTNNASLIEEKIYDFSDNESCASVDYSPYLTQINQDISNIADFNGSGRVDGFDLAILGNTFGTSSSDENYNLAVDLNTSGRIDGFDLAIFATHFGEIGPNDRALDDIENSNTNLVSKLELSHDYSNLEIGDIIEIPITLRNDYSCLGIAFDLDFNPDIFEVIDFYFMDTMISNQNINFYSINNQVGKVIIGTSTKYLNIDYLRGLTNIATVSFKVISQFSNETILVDNQNLIEYGGATFIELDANEVDLTSDVNEVSFVESLSNYPNPFNPTTTISFTLPKSEEVEITIYNIKGQRVKELIKGQLKAGINNVIWDGKNENGLMSSSGVYLYRIKTDSNNIVRKMSLMK